MNVVKRINEIWDAANWNWHAQNDNKRFFWHWSPRNGFDMNFPVKGWNEALIAYIISASSSRHPISKEVYEKTWVNTRSWRNGKSYYGYTLPLGNWPGGGPLFFSQYTFMAGAPYRLTGACACPFDPPTTNQTAITPAWTIQKTYRHKRTGGQEAGRSAGETHKRHVP